jgi:hypothetical protein
MFCTLFLLGFLVKEDSSDMEEYKKDSNWIWSPFWDAQDKECPRIMLFRKSVELKENPCWGKIKISADTRYKLYVNGSLAETGPSRGDPQVWFYDTVDLLPFLKKGMNQISVSVLRYPEDPQKGNHGMFRTPVPGLYAVGEIADMEGEKYDISADASWKCRIDRSVHFYREEERFAPLVIHEHAAGNPEVFGWKNIAYDDSRWERAKPYMKKLAPQAVSPGNLKPRNIPYMYRKSARFKSVMDLKQSICGREEWEAFLQGTKKLTIPPRTEEIVEIDAGEEMTGYLWLSLTGGAGTEATLLYAEAYVQDECAGPEQIPLKGDRMDKEQGHLQGYEDRYLAAGLGTEEQPEIYEPYWFRTFRFVRLSIRTAQESVTLERLDYEETGYPLEISTSVRTSDRSLEPVWEISKRTLKRCMHETYVDCPFYEQLQYQIQARILDTGC